MLIRVTALTTIAAILTATAPANAQPPAPKGEVTKYTFSSSKIYPGTVRDYWVYVPQQYDAKKPACVHVNQEGIQFNAPAVFDELVHKKEMPVTIGVFVMPGVVKAADDKALDRFNRSYEYDSLSDNYVRFLLDELLPDVETRKTADGKPIKLSKSGNDRSIGGASSGAICAFTAAWERPDAFSRVFSAIGAYVDLRGGNTYPTLIRKYEPKPIRVFLQDGSNDLDTIAGDWWLANQEMQRALKFAGYEVKNEWGDGGHDTKHADKLFPQAMKWLWKDWPTPVKVGGSKEMKEILTEGEGWKLAAERTLGKYSKYGPVVANSKGEVFFVAHNPKDGFRQQIYKIGVDAKVNDFRREVGTHDSLHSIHASGPDKRLYGLAVQTLGVSSAGNVIAYDEDGKMERIGGRLTVTSGVGAETYSLVVRHDGGLFVTGGRDSGVMWYFDPKGKPRVVYEGKNSDQGVFQCITLSPDQTMLYAANTEQGVKSPWVYSFQIQKDDSLSHLQQFYHLHIDDNALGARVTGMCVDRDGRLYVATRMGIQICDQMGRANCIIPVPNGQPTGLCFGGANFDTLFVTCGDKIYSRKLKTRGANAFEPPIKPKSPGL